MNRRQFLASLPLVGVVAGTTVSARPIKGPILQPFSSKIFGGLTAINTGVSTVQAELIPPPTGGSSWWLFGFNLSSACVNEGTGANDVVNLGFGIYTNPLVSIDANSVLAIHSYLFTGPTGRVLSSNVSFGDTPILIGAGQSVCLLYGTAVDSGLTKSQQTVVNFFWDYK